MNHLIKNRTGFNHQMNEFPTFFDDLFARNNSFLSHKINGTVPAVNIKESSTGFELELAVPGMEKSDFKIDLKKDLLTISAQKEKKKEETVEEKYFRKEFSYSSFSRSFTLPEGKVDIENINAVYENGILKVNIPKTEKSELIKEITIK